MQLLPTRAADRGAVRRELETERRGLGVVLTVTRSVMTEVSCLVDLGYSMLPCRKGGDSVYTPVFSKRQAYFPW